MAKKNVKELIIASAKELFLKHGFKRVNIEDVCNRAGVSRKTFYVYYVNKHDLVISVLTVIFDAIIKEYIAIINSDRGFSVKVEQILELNIEFGKRISTEFLNDVYKTYDDQAKSYFLKLMEQNQSMVINFLNQAQANGDIRADINLNVIVYMQNGLLQLCRKESFVALFPDVQTMIKQVSGIYLYGILNKNV